MGYKREEEGRRGKKKGEKRRDVLAVIMTENFSDFWSDSRSQSEVS